MTSKKIRVRYSPCSSCPFVKDRPTAVRYLSADRTEEISETLLSGNGFTCHKDNDIDLGRRAQCAGAMLILRKLQRPNIAMLLLRFLGLLDFDKLRGAESVFDNFEQWKEAQQKSIESLKHDTSGPERI
jgi:hypothetical protein